MLGKYDFHINDDDTKINLKVDTPNDRYLLNYIRLKIIDKSPPPPKFDNKGTKIWQGANTESNNQLIINNNLITTTDSGGVLSITSNGTNSTLNLNSVLIDAQGDVSGINNLTVDGVFKSPSTAKAWCRFSNTSGSLAMLASYGILGVTYKRIPNITLNVQSCPMHLL